VANKCLRLEEKDQTPQKKTEEKYKRIIISFNNLIKNIGLVNQK
jgi:hypothetical protein